MKAGKVGRHGLLCMLMVLLAVPQGVLAQGPPPAPPPPGGAQPSAAFNPEELEQLAVPIALYPDPLLAQGPDAPEGARDYIVRGKTIGGFTMVAYPDQYGVSGVMTFIVNQDGVVQQKDLGRDTTKVAQGMQAYNPDSTWKQAEGAAGPAK
jgi:hypothetical protein